MLLQFNVIIYLLFLLQTRPALLSNNVNTLKTRIKFSFSLFFFTFTKNNLLNKIYQETLTSEGLIGRHIKHVPKVKTIKNSII